MKCSSMRIRFGLYRRRNFLSWSSQIHFSAIQHYSNSSSLYLYYTYSYLLECCFQECKRIKANHVFDKMRLQESRNGKLIHSLSIKCGLASSGLLPNMIVDLYAKCGLVSLAEKTFHRLEFRDILAWNSILSMYLNQTTLELVVNSFGTLWSFGVSPNDYTFSIVLSACSRLRDFRYAKQIHCIIVKSGFESSSFFKGALIDVYAKTNFIGDARRVLQGAVNLDVVSWTSMISGYVRAGLPEEAFKVFKEMQKLGHQPDQVAFVTVINACVDLETLDNACHLFSQMPNPNVVAWNVMISGHAKRGFEVEAIAFFQKMRKSGVRSTRSTLASLLGAISGIQALGIGVQVHAEAIKEGLHASVYVGSALISMYGKCDKMEYMKRIYDDLNEKNVVMWNAMLGGYAQNGYAREVIELFYEMKASRFDPDEFTYTSVLSACGCLEYQQTGLQMHSVVIKNKLASNLFVGNALVDMYAKFGALTEARKQFELIKNHDNVSWNAIIVGYVQDEDEREAFSMFRRMNRIGQLPDEVSLSSILSACANVRDFEQAKQVHCLSVKCGLENGLYTGSSLIDMYAKCGVIEAANKVLSSMPRRSVVSMNAIISGYAQNNLNKAINLFREMNGENLKPSEVTFASLLDACIGPQKLCLGRQIHCVTAKLGLLHKDELLEVSLIGMYMKSRKMWDANLFFSELPDPKSTVLWTIMISGYTHNELPDKALQLYEQMHSYNVLFDQASYVSILKACAMLSSLREGKVTHSLVFHMGYDLDELTGSALVDMYAKCGDIKSAAQVFEEIHYKHDIISWNSMIVGFAKNGFAEDALRIFDEMKKSNIFPDDVTFLGVLTACSHSGKVSEGRQIFDDMIKYYKIQPRADHCACMVDLLGRGGLLKETEEFIDQLNVEPNAMIWSSMLGACKMHLDETRGRRAAEKLIELEPNSSSPYVLLSNIYAASGNWNEVNSLRKAMREKRVKKLPGCSWIVMENKTGLFVAGDKSHPSANEIDAIVKDLTKQLKDDGCVDANDFFWRDME